MYTPARRGCIIRALITRYIFKFNAKVPYLLFKRPGTVFACLNVRAYVLWKREIRVLCKRCTFAAHTGRVG